MLSDDAIEFFWKNGYVPLGRVITRAQANEIRGHVEQFEAEHPLDVGKLDLKANLLFTWCDDLSSHPAVLPDLAQLLGPDILCHTAAFRNKAPDGRTHVSWHQYTTYEHVDPCKVIAWYAITDATKENGCLRFMPGSHRWGQLEHTEGDDPDSMLSHKHFVSESMDGGNAVEMELEAGEAVFFHYGVVHGALPNNSKDRRMGLFFDYFAAESVHAGARESARLVHGVDTVGNYDVDPGPIKNYGPDEIEAHRHAVEKLSENFYSEWEGDVEALSGRTRNRI